MNHPSIYHNANCVQRHDAKRILKEYANVIQWQTEGRDRLLDVGSGSGNVLIDYIYPLLPNDFEEIIGSDVSAKMVNYANKIYSKYNGVKFMVLDICGEELPKSLVERFDHVTSFYCLHWIQNHRKALGNIYQLLRKNSGDCLLVFLATNPIFDIYESLSKSPKWFKYMQDYKRYVSPLHHSKNPGQDFAELLQEVGFKYYNVEIRNEVYSYEGIKSLRNNAEAVCPFLDRIPRENHEDFFQDFIKIMVDLNLRQSIENSEDFRFICPYKLVVAYARKSMETLEKISCGENKIQNGMNGN